MEVKWRGWKSADKLFASYSEITGIVYIRDFEGIARKTRDITSPFFRDAYDVAKLGHKIVTALAVVSELGKVLQELMPTNPSFPPYWQERAEELNEKKAGIERERRTLFSQKQNGLPAANRIITELVSVLNDSLRLPKLKYPDAQLAKDSWDQGLNDIIDSAKCYVSWTETESLEFLTDTLAGMHSFILNCTTRKLYLDTYAPNERKQVEKELKNKTLMELIEPFIKFLGDEVKTA